MAHRESKRKQPKREDKQIKEQWKLESRVFDKQTLLCLSSMMKKGLFKSLDYPVATGKEADVYRASTETGFLAVKIYRVDTTSFIHIHNYIEGDPRFFGISHNKRDTIFAWARKEFRNLKICMDANVHAPAPIYCDRNILVMEFLGLNGIPYSTLVQTGSEEPENDLKILLEDVRKLYALGLVHADLSEFNIMMDVRGPYMIDIGQAVLLRHPRAEEYLERDVANILRYFGKYGIKKDLQETLKWIREAGSEAKKDATRREERALRRGKARAESENLHVEG